MPEPLKRKDRNGALYLRPPEIEAWLKRLEALDTAERLRQLEFSSKTSEYVPSEALVYFLRSSWAAIGTKVEFEKIFRILMKRIEASLCSVISDASMAGARNIREEIMARFAERIAKDCKMRSGLLDFYEIRFNKAFEAFRISALRQLGPSSLETVPLSTEEDDVMVISPEIEKAAAEFFGGFSSQYDDPAFRLEFTAAIDCLPDDQKQVIWLLLQDFQIDSKDPNVMTIARILKCDERTVRNRRDRAYKTLRTVLQKEYAQ